MATLAIEGHKTRGKEVIEILEMLGGDNKYHINTTECNLLYTIREGDDVIIGTYPNSSISQIYTLEEFLEKFPYKVGDKVVYTKFGDDYPIIIQSMKWTGTTIEYTFDGCVTCLVKDLQPYKEETMEENNEKSANHVFDTEVITFDIAQRDKYELDLQGKFQVVLREGKYYVERIKPKYPTTYEECCKVLGIQSDWHLTFELNNSAPCDLYVNKEFDYVCKLEAFRKLFICRNAYWKIAGEEMGLGKPWEPRWNDNYQTKWIINFYQDEINLTKGSNMHNFLAFPTKETRDAYKENFDIDIEACKEFL